MDGKTRYVQIFNVDSEMQQVLPVALVDWHQYYSTTSTVDMQLIFEQCLNTPKNPTEVMIENHGETGDHLQNTISDVHGTL